MDNLIIGLLGALMASNPPAALSNLVSQTTGIRISIPDPNDPVEKEFKKLMQDDDDALDDVDKWIKENRAAAGGGGVTDRELTDRIRARLAVVRKEYEDFLKRHPDHSRAHLAFGAFLDEAGDDETAVAEIRRTLELDPKNAAAWNNLGNHYSHIGPPSKMFDFFTKAIELNSQEPVYYQNLADAVFVYRQPAMEYYKLKDEQEVFNKSLELYQQAFKLAPTNFHLATELANNYYGILPTRTDDALNAWSNALKVASTDVEREGVYIHLARFKLNAGRFAESRQNLNSVTNAMYDDLKHRLLRNLNEREKEQATNKPAAEKK